MARFIPLFCILVLEVLTPTFQNKIPMPMNDTNYELTAQLQHMMKIRSPMQFLRTNPAWLHEGDIALLPEGRKSVTSGFWPNAEVPYTLDPTLSATILAQLQVSLNDWQQKTCLRFVDKTNDATFNINTENSVYITDDDSGCYSYVGRVPLRPQNVNIGSGCQFSEVIIHELGHAIGFNHEQSRSGRDEFVRILFQNIIPSTVGNFNERTTNNFDIPYDYLSIMHYDSEGFATTRFGLNTIQSIDPRYQYLMGRGAVLSFRDAKAAFKMYCQEKQATDCNLSSSDICGDGYLLPDCTCSCPSGVSGNNCETGSETPASLPCGGEITSEGTYSTPNYPSRSPNFLERSCVWTIKTDPTRKVQVHFDGFSFRPRDSRFNNVCVFEKVEVRLNGANSEGPFVCENDYLGQTLESINNEMVILVDSPFYRNSDSGLRFQVTFLGGPTTVEPTEEITTMEPTEEITTMEPTEAITTMEPTEEITTIEPTENPFTTETPIPRISCGDVSDTIRLKNGESYEITSDDYGISNYLPRTKCTVKVKTSNRSDMMKVEIVDLDLQESTDCKKDYVRLRKTRSRVDLFKLCGTTSNEVYMFEENRLKLKFKSNRSVQKSGFLIRFTAVSPAP